MLVTRLQQVYSLGIIGESKVYLGVDGLDLSGEGVRLGLQPHQNALDTPKLRLVSRDRVSRVLQIPGKGVDALGLRRADEQELLLLHQACLDLGEELLLTPGEPELEVQGCKLGWKGSQPLVLVIPECTVLV